MTPTERREGDGWKSREVPLDDSHRGGWTRVSVRDCETHATVEFSGYWHSASISMSLAELERVRDAINAVLVEIS